MPFEGPVETTVIATLEGGCLCGEVRYRTKGLPERLTVCHCLWCQHRTGSAFGAECVFELDHVAMVGSSPRAWRSVSDESRRWIERDFCATCGTPIGLRLEAVPNIRSLALGSFDDTSWLDDDAVATRHVFVRSAKDLTLVPDHVERYEMHFRR